VVIPQAMRALTDVVGSRLTRVRRVPNVYRGVPDTDFGPLPISLYLDQQRHRCAAPRRRFPRRAQPRWPAHAGAPPGRTITAMLYSVLARLALGLVFLDCDCPARGHHVNAAFGAAPRSNAA